MCDNNEVVTCVCVGKYSDHSEALLQQRHYADTMLSAYRQNVSAVPPSHLSSVITDAATTFENLGDRKVMQNCVNV